MTAVGLRALTLLLCAFATVEASAADDPRVRLELGACDAMRLEDIRARVAIELPGALGSSHVPFAATVVRVDCTPASVQLTVDDPLTMKGLTRTIALRNADSDVRSRTVAIAIAELVAASWAELEMNPSPRVPTGAKAPPIVIAEALRALHPSHGLLDGRMRLSAVVSTQVFFSTANVLWGGGLRLSHDASRYVGWAADLLAHHGGIDATLGHVSVDTLTVGGSALAHRDWRRVGLGGGLGFRIGTTLVHGSASEGSGAREGSVTWAAGGPFGTFALHVYPVRGLVIHLATEGGYWLFPTGGLIDGRRAVSVEGPWLGVQLGIGIAL